MFKQANPSYAQLDGGIGGLERVGEMLYPGENLSSEITPERLLDPCLAPRSELALSIFRRWMENAPAVNAFQILDLYYIEQRLGCWGGDLNYAECPDPGFLIFPMCHREIIERMITLPVQYRLAGTLMKDVITREWPELLAWPFNEPDGWKKVVLAASRTHSSLKFQWSRIGRALQNPGRAFTRVAESIHLTVF